MADDDRDGGGDVASRDPEEIAREIEQTRAELADTIDAIADRVSPKRVVSRGTASVKALVSSGPAGSDPDAAGASTGPAVTPQMIAAGLGALAILIVLLRRRRSR